MRSQTTWLCFIPPRFLHVLHPVTTQHPPSTRHHQHPNQPVGHGRAGCCPGAAESAGLVLTASGLGFIFKPCRCHLGKSTRVTLSGIFQPDDTEPASSILNELGFFNNFCSWVVARNSLWLERGLGYPGWELLRAPKHVLCGSVPTRPLCKDD